jgi:hypothetical protein
MQRMRRCISLARNADLHNFVNCPNALQGVLKRLKDETQQLKDDPAAKKSEIRCAEGSPFSFHLHILMYILINAVCRIRENLLITLTRKFVDMMKEYQNCQVKYPHI